MLLRRSVSYLSPYDLDYLDITIAYSVQSGRQEVGTGTRTLTLPATQTTPTTDHERTFLMELIVRRPQRATPEFGSLGRAMNRFFDDSFFTARGSRGVSYATLPVDISEREGDLVVRASVPGFAKAEIEVRVNDGVLSISASHSEEIEDGDDDGAESEEHYYRRERRSGTLSRRITLPSKVRDSEVDAELADGVLTLTIPTPEEEKPKQIEIRTSK